jgi:hypothetical protein
LEVPPEQSTSQTVTPVIMDVEPTSQTKGKELETFDLSKGISLITPHNVDESFDVSENFLDPNTPSV